MTLFNHLPFRPLPGLRSPHLQTILVNYGRVGKAPPSEALYIDLKEDDKLVCEVSTPSQWASHDPTIILIHGLGGSHSSGYMVRLSRKLYHLGYRVVRVSLRGCGSGKGLSKLPYNAGTSGDILEIIQVLKQKYTQSPITLIGFSLGGNIALKLAGELGPQASKWIHKVIAVCPPIDLSHCIHRISQGFNKLYHHYYLDKLIKQSKIWLKEHKVRSILEFDEKVTAPLWGYKDAKDYYTQCSAGAFIPKIEIPCHILFSADDPFIDYHLLENITIPSCVNIWISPHGGHMGFLGWITPTRAGYWMDHLLLEWIGDLEKS